MELLLGFNVEVLNNSCNTCTRVLSDMYTLIPQACGSWDSDVHIRQTTRVVLQLLNVAAVNTINRPAVNTINRPTVNTINRSDVFHELYDM